MMHYSKLSAVTFLTVISILVFAASASPIGSTIGMQQREKAHFRAYTTRLDTVSVAIADTCVFILVSPPVCRSCISTMAEWLDDVPAQRAVVYDIKGSRYDARQMFVAYEEQNEGIRSPVLASRLDSVIRNPEVLAIVRESQRSGPVILAIRGGRMQVTSWPAFKDFAEGSQPWHNVLP